MSSRKVEAIGISETTEACPDAFAEVMNGIFLARLRGRLAVGQTCVLLRLGLLLALENRIAVFASALEADNLTRRADRSKKPRVFTLANATIGPTRGAPKHIP